MAGSFCYSLAKSNVFAPLTSLRDVQRKTLLPRAMGCTPFLTFTVQKIHCFFGPQKWPRKNRREQRTEKLPTAIFACPSFADNFSCAKIISKRMVFARRTNQRAICPRTTQTKKRAWNLAINHFYQCTFYREKKNTGQRNSCILKIT